MWETWCSIGSCVTKYTRIWPLLHTSNVKVETKPVGGRLGTSLQGKLVSLLFHINQKAHKKCLITSKYFLYLCLHVHEKHGWRNSRQKDRWSQRDVSGHLAVPRQKVSIPKTMRSTSRRSKSEWLTHTFKCCMATYQYEQGLILAAPSICVLLQTYTSNFN